jgi:glycosyltransferase involved in cell wall biosynthesis
MFNLKVMDSQSKAAWEPRVQRRPAILMYSAPHRWTSCRAIAANLAQAYDQAFDGGCLFFKFPRVHEPDTVENIVFSIFKSNPSEIVLIDNNFPGPAPIISALKRRFGDRMPTLYIHVYGDFGRACAHWIQLEKTLLGSEVHFICASSRHRAFMDSLIHGGGLTYDCPYPVSARDYDFDAELRERERKRFGLRAEDRLIVYTGRLTLQKNVLRLTEEFRRLMAGGREPYALYLAGSFDNLGGPFDHRIPVPGLIYGRLQSLIDQLPTNQRPRIRYLGALDSNQLRGLYCAADGFASLSLFHGEDFGMSPVEASMTGLPACLTDWGGFSDFDIDPESVFYVPAHIDETGLFLKSAEIQNALRKLMAIDNGEQARRRRGRLYRSRFSVDAVAERIREFHAREIPRFTGFSKAMHVLAERMSLASEGRLAFPEGMGRSSLYHEIHKYYLRPAPLRGRATEAKADDMTLGAAIDANEVFNLVREPASAETEP